MDDRVLVIGSGGAHKFRYIEALLELDAFVVILDPEGEHWGAAGYFAGEERVETLECRFDDLGEILAEATALHARHDFTKVDTIFELTLEAAADIRAELGNADGLSREQTEFGRRKSKMLELGDGADVRFAPSLVLRDDDMVPEAIEWCREQGTGPWVLRPDRGGGNIGVVPFENEADLQEVLDLAKGLVKEHPYRPVVYYDIADQWVISKYIDGHEIETEVLVHKDEVVHLSMLLKSVNIERKIGIEENRYVTPVPWLQPQMIIDLENQVSALARAVWERVMKHAGRERYVLHPEYRVDAGGQAHTIEFAFRNGGGLNPIAVMKSTGVDIHKYAAMGALGCDGSWQAKPTSGACGYQMIYSDRAGIYNGMEGVRKANALLWWEGMDVGTRISAPHLEMVRYVMAMEATPEAVEETLDQALADAHVLVDGDRIPVPLSHYRSDQPSEDKTRETRGGA